MQFPKPLIFGAYEKCGLLNLQSRPFAFLPGTRGFSCSGVRPRPRRRLRCRAGTRRTFARCKCSSTKFLHVANVRRRIFARCKCSSHLQIFSNPIVFKIWTAKFVNICKLQIFVAKYLHVANVCRRNICTRKCFVSDRSSFLAQRGGQAPCRTRVAAAFSRPGPRRGARERGGRSREGPLSATGQET